MSNASFEGIVELTLTKFYIKKSNRISIKAVILPKGLSKISCH